MTMTASNVRNFTNLIVSLSAVMLLSGCLMNDSTEEAAAAPPGGNNSNAMPEISGTPPRMIKVGVAYAFTPQAMDPDADALTFSVSNKPGWLDFNTNTGALTGMPLLGSERTYNDIGISVTDGNLSASLSPFSITVEPVTAPNMPPEISGTPAAAVTTGDNYAFTPAASDPDGDMLTFAVQNMPGWATFNNQTGALSGTPAAGDEGVYQGIAISVSDATASASLPAFSLTVNPANVMPMISGTPAVSVVAGSSYSFTPTASDPNGDTLTFTVQNLPDWATFDASSGQIAGTPQMSDVGPWNGIEISVSDGVFSAALPTFTITVTAANLAPQISGTPGNAVNVGQAYSFTPTANDAEGDTLVFTIQNPPSWAQFDSATGALTGTPQAGNTGSYPGIVITVDDGNLSASLSPFSITVVTAPNMPPEISGTPAAAVTTGDNYAFTPAASDPDGDMLTFAVQNMPGWATFNNQTGALSGTPAAGDEGVYQGIAISVSDATASASLPAFSLTVNPANVMPMISGTPAVSVVAGSSYSFTPTASDPNGDTLTFTVQNLPDWATFDASSGQIAGTPQMSDVGPWNGIEISVSDGVFSAALPTFTITVTAANSAPQISGTPGNAVNVGQAYSFTPTANDADGDTLVFTIQNPPSWAQFDSATGALTGTPQVGDAGSYPGIVITVDDGNQTASLQAFSITVSQVAMGSATLSWTPPTQNADGSPLNNLAGYRVYYGTSPGTYPNMELVNNPGVSSYVVNGLTTGTWYFVSTTVNTDGIESAFSNMASKTIN